MTHIQTLMGNLNTYSSIYHKENNRENRLYILDILSNDVSTLYLRL